MRHLATLDHSFVPFFALKVRTRKRWKSNFWTVQATAFKLVAFALEWRFYPEKTYDTSHIGPGWPKYRPKRPSFPAGHLKTASSCIWPSSIWSNHGLHWLKSSPYHWMLSHVFARILISLLRNQNRDLIIWKWSNAIGTCYTWRGPMPVNFRYKVGTPNFSPRHVTFKKLNDLDLDLEPLF